MKAEGLAEACCADRFVGACRRCVRGRPDHRASPRGQSPVRDRRRAYTDADVARRMVVNRPPTP
ncbi:hypothetical protein ACRAWD_23995 [Caulobacter segnis]